MGCELEHRAVNCHEKTSRHCAVWNGDHLLLYSQPFSCHKPLNKHNEVYNIQKHKQSHVQLSLNYVPLYFIHPNYRTS